MKEIIKFSLVLIGIITLLSCGEKSLTIKESKNDLNFTTLAQSWDEGMPLGNAIVGSLVWGKGETLRM